MPSFLISLVLDGARTLDDIAQHSVASATSSTVVVTQLVNLTTGASADRYNGTHVFHRQAGLPGQSRTVRPGGYAPSTGTLTVFPNWTTTPTAGDLIYLTHKFPVISEGADGGTDSRALVNKSLRKLSIPDRVHLAIGTGYAYPLTSFTWLDRPERLVRVLEPGPTGGEPVDASWRGPRLVLDGPTPTLNLRVPFENATGSLTLEVMRPGHTLIATAGVWAESTGLINDTDQCLPNAEDVLPQFMAEAYAALASRTPGRPYPGADAARKAWLQVARRGRYYDRSNESPEEAAVPSEAAA